jgi:flagellar motor switch protein FliN
MAVVPPSTPPAEVTSPESLLDVNMRFWVELGRSRMPVANAVGLASGAIVDLDRAPEDPVDIYVNGRHFGVGRLLQVDGEWAVRLETLTAPAEPDAE